MSEIVYFKHAIDIPNVKTSGEFEELSIPILLEASLYFANPEDIKDKSKGPVDDEYKPVNSKVYRLGNLLSGGVFKYVPVQFSGEFSSLIDTTVHVLVNNVTVNAATIFESKKDKISIEKKSSAEVKNNSKWF
jgi:hypothetical protein